MLPLDAEAVTKLVNAGFEAILPAPNGSGPLGKASWYMRVLLVLIGMTLASQVNATESLRVDDVPIQGRLHELSASDLNEAIVAFTTTRSEKPATLEVISSTEIHSRLQNKDLGWLSMRRMPTYGPPPIPARTRFSDGQ